MIGLIDPKLPSSGPPRRRLGALSIQASIFNLRPWLSGSPRTDAEAKLRRVVLLSFGNILSANSVMVEANGSLPLATLETDRTEAALELDARFLTIET